MIRVFRLYRPHPPPSYLETGAALPADLPQLEGCIFSDGTTVIRWRTLDRSTAIFPSFEAFLTVHGHPEYGTRIEWLNG